MKGASGFAVVALIVLAAAAYLLTAQDGQLNLNSIFASFGGFSTLSLSQADFVSNDPTVGGKAWILTVVQNGAGQTASGTFTATDGDQTSKSFTIDTSVTENKATYPVRQNGQFIYKENHELFVGQAINPLFRCEDKGYPFTIKSKFGLFDIICWKYTSQAAVGTIDSPTTSFKSDISVRGTSGTQACTVSNIGQSSCSLGSVGLVTWQGNLVSGQSLPSPAGQDITAAYDTTIFPGWKTTRLSSVNTYLSYHNGGLVACMSGAPDSDYIINTCLKTYNTYSSNALAGKPFVSEGGQFATSSGSASNGQISLDLGKQIQFPVLTFKLKADFIGINELSGTPKIASVSSEEFQTGKTGFITVSVQNIGDGRGSFDVFATCQSPISVTGATSRISLDPGQSGQVYITISGISTSGSVSSSCTVTAQDVANPTKKDTKSVAVKVSAITICQTGEKRVNGNSIEICESNQWRLLTDCGADKTAQNVNGIPQCVDKPTSDGSGCGFLGLNCANPFAGLGSFFAGIGFVVLLGVIIVVALFATGRIGRR